MPSYSPKFKETIIKKIMPPNTMSSIEIQGETGIAYQTLVNWKNKALKSGFAAVGSSRSAHDWSDEAK